MPAVVNNTVGSFSGIKEEFGIERFKEVIKQTNHLQPKDIVKAVYREVSDFAGNEPQLDDFTLFLLKRKEREKGGRGES